MTSSDIDMPNPYRLGVSKPPLARPSQLDFAERQRQAVYYYGCGWTYQDIGLLLAADPTVNSNSEAVRGGYGWTSYINGKPPISPTSLRNQAVRDIQRAQKTVRESMMEESTRQFIASLGRMDECVKMAWVPAARTGSHWHIFRIIQAEERRSKLWRWESPSAADTGPLAIGAGSGADEPADGPQALGVGDPIPYSPEFMEEVFETLQASGLIPPDSVDPASFIPDVDVIDADSVEIPVPADQS